MGPKHVPMRMCVACRQNFPKREMIRIVREPGGEVMIDPSGKRAGRGAYICRRPECRENLGTRRSIEHALRTALTDDEWARLSNPIEPR